MSEKGRRKWKVNIALGAKMNRSIVRLHQVNRQAPLRHALSIYLCNLLSLSILHFIIPDFASIYLIRIIIVMRLVDVIYYQVAYKREVPLR